MNKELVTLKIEMDSLLRDNKVYFNKFFTNYLVMIRTNDLLEELIEHINSIKELYDNISQKKYDSEDKKYFAENVITLYGSKFISQLSLYCLYKENLKSRGIDYKDFETFNGDLENNIKSILDILEEYINKDKISDIKNQYFGTLDESKQLKK